ncbi:MAG TPA: serine hydrolase [Tepidiformaceae bacterium]|nr:serine hydrolase [Tepidiformaceae bacterium]
MRAPFATIAVCLWTAIALGAEPDAKKDIIKFAATVVRDFPEVPGFGLAIVRDGKPYLTAGFGLADREKRVAAGADTVYYIASSTKSFTGLAAAILHTRGTIDLDAPLTRYVPEAKFPEGVDPQRITLRRLLTHTLGFENDPIVTRTAFTGEHTPAKIVELIASSRRLETDQFHYDNIGYVVAAIAMERATGRKWQDLLQQLVFTPIGMKHTSAYISKAERWPLAEAYAIGRSASLERLPRLKTDATMHAAGGMVTTPRDAALWLEANLNEGRVGGKQAIPAAAIALAHTTQAATDSRAYRFSRKGYGLGWFTGEFEGEPFLHHFGGFEGWRAHISFMPGRDIGVAVFTNATGPAGAMPDIVAAYVYDRLRLGPEANEKYAKELAERKNTNSQLMERFRKDLENRARRVSMLKHPPEAYTGDFTNPAYGKLVIRANDNALHASIGQLSAVLEPFTEVESARVELVPGNGEVLRFSFDSGDRATSVKWRDEVFQRSGPRSE